MTIAGKAVLVTGANRGLGQVLVVEALRRGAKHVYAGTRQPLSHPDERVTPLLLDVTDRAHIQAARNRVDALDILINNAGVSVPDDLSQRSVLEQHLAVNLYGTLDITRAFLPLLTRRHGVVVNVVSLGAVAAVPVLLSLALSRYAKSYSIENERSRPRSGRTTQVGVCQGRGGRAEQPGCDGWRVGGAERTAAREEGRTARRAEQREHLAPAQDAANLAVVVVH